MSMILNTAHCVNHCWHKIHWITCQASNNKVSLIALVTCAKIQADLSDNWGQYIPPTWTYDRALIGSSNWPFCVDAQMFLLWKCQCIHSSVFLKLWYSGGKKVWGDAFCVLNAVSVFHFHSVLDYFVTVPLRTRSREGRGEDKQGRIAVAEWESRGERR